VEWAERAYYLLCLTLGRLLRSARYTKARIVRDDGVLHVHKRRTFYAPLLVWLSGPLVRILNTGVQVLPQRDWVERERQMYQRLYGSSIRVADDGTLLLPHLAGSTLATLLENSQLDESIRKNAIELAVIALAKFMAWDSPMRMPWPRTSWSTSNLESPTGSTSRPCTVRGGPSNGAERMTFAHCW
jgi:hypothetical protein